ncbi:MAG: 16S rRNA (guanine(527)-N(7))-methyltransferase RsmG [Chloroflexi bacterium]|nr:16S rRNA (guanine(527)-N(7))-methyltransferase RsmG [Chloroflexota bacterium]
MKLLLQEAKRWGINLTPEQVESFRIYYQELLSWHERASLTTVTDPEGVQIQHFLDSLSCLLVLEPWLKGGARVIDIGTGAGFPGLPMKIVRPGISLVLLESTRKKVEFLQHLVGLLGLQGVETVWGRAEEAGHEPRFRASFDIALGRAVGPFPVLLEYALPFLKLGGVLVAQRGQAGKREIQEATKALDLLGGQIKQIREVLLPNRREPRYLVVVEKVAITPEKYPRRPGVPHKKPLV